MASYYNTEKAAELLGVTPAEVNRMRERRELNGYRDGVDWKFKVEDVEALIAKRSGGGEEEDADSGDDSVLLSEVALGESDSGSSGTVIGMEDASGASDIRLSDDDDGLIAPDTPGSSLSELDLTLDDSGMSLAGEESGSHPRSDHALDDDLALGASGSGSDITVGGDSGISLVDPADSGLSLVDPLEFSADTSSDETLALDEDDMLLEEPSKGGSGDFVLEPARDEGAESDDSDSGSQVIALDLEAEGDDDATMISGAAGSAPAALPDDFAAADAGLVSIPAETGPSFTPASGAMPTVGGEAAPGRSAAQPEAPYTALNVVSLALCCLLLVFCGMFMYDLMRNMWSWNGAYSVNSSMMDFLLSLFES